MKSLITLSESKRFVELEKSIERGKKTFVEVGTALAEIRDSKLYRADHATFEEYCREKWGWSRPYCIQIMQAAQVVNSLPDGVAIATESQARALSKAALEDRPAILEKVKASGPVTAAKIAEAIEEQKQPDPIAFQASEAKHHLGNLELPKNRGHEAACSLAIQTEEWLTLDLEELPAIKMQAELTFRQLRDRIEQLKKEKMK